MNANETIDAALWTAVRKRRLVLAVRSALIGLSVVGAWVLLTMLIDRWVHGAIRTRVATAGVTATLAIMAILRVICVGWPRQLDATATARFVEAIDPAWGERLITVVTQSRLPATHRGSAAMNEALTEAVARELAARPPAKRVTFGTARPALSAVGVVIVAWGAVWATPSMEADRLLRRQMWPTAALPPVTTTRIEVLAHAMTVPQGRNLSIVADVSGGEPVTMQVGPDTDHLQPVAMRQTYGGRYSATLLSLQDDFVYCVSAGDASVGPVKVGVVRTPGVTSMDVTLTPPGGSAAATRENSDGRLRVSPGTTVGVLFRMTSPVREATLRVGKRRIAAKPDAARLVWQGEFTVDVSTDWAIELLADDDRRVPGPAGLYVTVR